MKLIQLSFLLLLVLFSCSKEENNNLEHRSDETLNECFEIPEKYITDIASNDVKTIFRNQNNEYVLYNAGEDNLIAFDENLDILWKKTYPKLNKIAVDEKDIRQNENGEILIVTGQENEYTELMTLSSDGTEIKSSVYQDDSKPFYRSVINSFESGYILEGSVFSFDTSWEPLVTKIDEDGNIIWFEIIPNGSELFYSGVRFQNKYLLTGTSAVTTPGKGRELFYHLVDESGNISDRTLIGFESGWNIKTIPTSDGGCITITAFDASDDQNMSNTECQVIKIAGSETVEWTKLYGGSDRELTADIIESKNGGYYILGNSKSYGLGHFDLFLIKTAFAKKIVLDSDDLADRVLALREQFYHPTSL